MGEEAERLVDFLSDISSTRQIMVNTGLYCKHDIIAEWCAACKYDKDRPSIKVILLQENLKIAENLDTWLQKPRTT